MKRKWLGFGVVLALSAVLGVWLVLGRDTRAASLPQGQAVVRAGRRNLDSVVKATGVVRPVVGAEVKVGSRASGVVERLYVRVGDHVERGRLLAALETRELAARRDQAAAALAAARVSAAYAQAERERTRGLASARVASQRDVELAERGADLGAAEVAQATANLRLTQVELDQARIVAPIAGVVASVATQEGETVSATLAAPTFVTIVDLTRLELWAYVDETDIGRIELGQAASFSVDAYPDVAFDGEVAAIYPKAEIRDNVVDYIVVIRFTPPRDRTLRPEMTASVRVVLARHADVLAVPRRAVRREGDRTFVLCSEAGLPVQRFVRTGARDETHVEILDGLRGGEEVLVGDAPAPGGAG